MQTLARHPRFTIAHPVLYRVPLGNEYLLPAIVVGRELDSGGYLYSIKLNGGFIVSPVPEQDLIVGNPVAKGFQQPNS